jgi:hypothetical protein
VSTLSVTPPTREMASTETLPIAMDFGPLLLAGEALSAPAVALTDLATNTAYAAGLTGNAQVVGTTVQQTVTALQPGHRYRLAATAQAASGKVWTLELQIACIF